MYPENIREILRDYFPGQSRFQIEELSEGLTNYNYRIEIQNSRPFFLKIFRNATMDRIRGISSLVKSLRAYNFPTPDIIPCADGSLYWSNGKSSAMMTEYIQGGYPEKNHANLYQIGNILAALHQIPAEGDLLKGYSLNYENQLEKILRSGKKVDDVLLQFIDKVTPMVQVINDKIFPESIIHGDVFLDNIMYNQMGDIYFIDFEGGCVAKSIFDLSRAVIGCAIVRDRIDLGLTRALISGYNIIRNLDENEHRYLYEFIVYSGAVSTFWRYNEFNIRRLAEDKKQLYTRLMNPVINFMKVSKQEFQESIYSEGNEL